VRTIILLGAALFLACAAARAAAAGASDAPKKHPVPVGTFIQWFLVKDWSDAQWQAEFRCMKELGMEYLVFAPTLDSARRIAYYATHLPGYQRAKGGRDVVDACLRNAQKASIRVFLGLNFHEDWWKKSARDPGWLYAQMEEGNAVADELFRHYRARYPRAFYGWYWVWEVDNLNFRKPEEVRALARALDINVRHLKTLDPAMPVMLCPFMNYRLGRPEAYAEMWKTVLANTALGKGDIFAPQDCVGAGGLTLDNFAAWFAALREAAATKPGLRFWSDTETFNQEDWTSATLDRFVTQLKGVQPYVEKSLTFAYSHYYSPNAVAPGYHRTLREYVRTGRLEASPPSAPTEARAERLEDGRVVVRWRAAADNIGVAGYYIFRDDQRIARAATGRDARTGDPFPPPPGAPLEFVDKGAPREGMPVYAVQAYDFAGNVSPKTPASQSISQLVNW
jgi:hypothetical protein